MCPRGVRPHPVPQSADSVWQATSPITVASYGLGPSHRTIVLRQTRRKDSNRNANPGHVTQWGFLQLALHVHPVTCRSNTL